MDKELLFRYIQGEASLQEKDQIVDWLDAGTANMREFMAMREVYDAILWNDAIDISQKTRKPAARKSKFRTFAVEFLKVASISLAALLIARFLIRDKSEPAVSYQTVCAPEGQRAEIILSDNTKVWLNAKSELTFPNDFAKTERNVWLMGEAYFDVSEDERKPFVVKTKEYDVKVLGTEFDVKSYPERNIFETSLIKGSILVKSLQTEREEILSPGFKASGIDGQLVVSRLRSQNHFLWRKGIISFEAETFSEILSKLELYYDVNIVINNEKVLTENGSAYTGKFWIKDGIGHVLKVLQLDHRFKFHKDDLNNITIY